jgi:hypothetical protein
MLDELFTKYRVSPLEISHGDGGDNAYLGGGGNLDFERAGTGGRGRKGRWGE